MNLLPPGFPRSLGCPVFPEKERFRKHQQPAKPLGQETVIASVHDGSTFHVSFLLNGPRGRSCTCNPPGLSGTPLLIGLHAGAGARPPCRGNGAPGQVCTDTGRGLSPLPLLWATGAITGAGGETRTLVGRFARRPVKLPSALNPISGLVAVR